VLHLLAIIWLASQSSRTALKEQSAISLINLSTAPGGAPDPAPPKPPESKAEIATPMVVAQLPSPVPAAAAAPAVPAAPEGGGLMGSGCALAQAVGDAILIDAAAMAELEALTREARTEADAVMLWDGRWQGLGAASATRLVVPPTATVPETVVFGGVRGVVEQVIRAAPTECSETPVIGPQFVALPGLERTTFLVIGSGTWRWADLLRPDAN